MPGGGSPSGWKALGLAMLFALVPTPPAMAQVYEVSESGRVETYDKPAVFTIGGVQQRGVGCNADHAGNGSVSRG